MAEYLNNTNKNNGNEDKILNRTDKGVYTGNSLIGAIFAFLIGKLGTLIISCYR